jgi:hypothetical protein
MRGLLAAVVVVAFVPRIAAAQRWQDATASCTGTTAEWSSKVELADVDGDGLPDILVANGGDYATPGTPEPVRVWKNLGNWTAAAPHCSEISSTAVLGFTGLSRMVKVGDLDGDGKVDIFTGGAWHTQAKLFLRGASGWTDASDHLPQQPTSIGDAELGDVDGDGDLDIVITDWGAQDPGATGYPGGPMRLYRNDGTGHFTEDTAAMPTQLIKWSWDIELVDVDNDWDLDILISCKSCTTSYLYLNDGTGKFTNAPNALPHYRNNYDFAPMDIDGDGYVDLATINDGPGSTNHIFHNRGDGTFADETTTRMTGTANPGADDNASVWLDADDDGDPDLLVGSLSGPDRLLLNDGHGVFTLAPGAATPDDTPGTLGIAVADLDGDGRVDVVQAQGEVAFPEKVQLATAMIAVDTHAPVIQVEPAPGPGGIVHARVHDRISPLRLVDLQSVELRANGQAVPVRWYGEYLWRAQLPANATTYEVCATDRRGNTACVPGGGNTGDGRGMSGDAGITQCPDSSACPRAGCCDVGGDPRGASLLVVVVGLCLRARSRRAGF